MRSVYNVEHTRTRAAHLWTNGRIERLNRTLKEAIFRGRWLISSPMQLDRLLAGFTTFYNRARPHSAWGGRTPNEVYFGLPRPSRPLGRVSYFEGTLHWYRLG